MFGDQEPLQTNAADPDQVAHGARREKDGRRRRNALLKQQLSTPDGREFVWSELERHGIHDDVMGSTEELQRFVGRRSAGLELLREVYRHPEAFLLMQQEAIARAQREADSNKAARTAPARDAGDRS